MQADLGPTVAHGSDHVGGSPAHTSLSSNPKHMKGGIGTTSTAPSDAANGLAPREGAARTHEQGPASHRHVRKTVHGGSVSGSSAESGSMEGGSSNEQEDASEPSCGNTPRNGEAVASRSDRLASSPRAATHNAGQQEQQYCVACQSTKHRKMYKLPWKFVRVEWVGSVPSSRHTLQVCCACYKVGAGACAFLLASPSPCCCCCCCCCWRDLRYCATLSGECGTGPVQVSRCIGLALTPMWLAQGFSAF